jgi:hypothetical protein
VEGRGQRVGVEGGGQRAEGGGRRRRAEGRGWRAGAEGWRVTGGLEGRKVGESKARGIEGPRDGGSELGGEDRGAYSSPVK